MSKPIKPMNLKKIQELTKKNHEKNINHILESQKTVIRRDIETKAFNGCNGCDVKFSQTNEVSTEDLDQIYTKLNKWCVDSGFYQLCKGEVNPGTRPSFWVEMFSTDKRAAEQIDRIYHFCW